MNVQINDKDVAGKKIWLWVVGKKRQVSVEGSGRSSKVGEFLVPHLRISQMDKHFQTILGTHIEWLTFYLVK